MKMSKQLYEQLENVARKVLAMPTVSLAKHREFIVAEGKAKDTDMRLRWDLFWACQKTDPTLQESIRREGLNDTHMDTALKALLKTLEG
jgi:hypothetical protein